MALQGPAAPRGAPLCPGRDGQHGAALRGDALVRRAGYAQRVHGCDQRHARHVVDEHGLDRALQGVRGDPRRAPAPKQRAPVVHHQPQAGQGLPGRQGLQQGRGAPRRAEAVLSPRGRLGRRSQGHAPAGRLRPRDPALQRDGGPGEDAGGVPPHRAPERGRGGPAHHGGDPRGRRKDVHATVGVEPGVQRVLRSVPGAPGGGEPPGQVVPQVRGAREHARAVRH
mmetsp:Transcript_1712/g.5928  ORF Transcript_1712/g.5928 Transcript_1712/m.5928 type:complete len:225 (-) Transcript_1712:664-1338(-)